jgi:CRP-like cAMP-binding protein
LQLDLGITMLSIDFFLQNLVHIGAMLYLICFLFRNQILLRIFAALGDLTYTGYYWVAADQPLWSAMTYSMMNVVINAFMIMLILNDQRQGTLSDNDMKLYQGFNGMTPGDFRRLSKVGVWRKADETITLTREGEPVTELHYVLDGELAITKGDRAIDVPSGLFIGEIAYLRKTPASATVTVKPGTTYISWPHDVLQKVTAKHDGLRQSLTSILSNDLAAKVARA